MKLYKEAGIDGKIEVCLSGDFDSLGAKLIREDFERLCDSDYINSVVLDLSRVEFIDSSGVGAIVFLYKRLIANQAKMAITGVKGQPADLLRLLRVDEALPVTFVDEPPTQKLGSL
jgi:anti-anti-sigma factor